MNCKNIASPAIVFALLLASYSNANAELPYIITSNTANTAFSAAKTESGVTRPDTVSKVADYAVTAVTSAAGLGLVNAAVQASGALQHVLPPGPGGRFLNPHCYGTIEQCRAGG